MTAIKSTTPRERFKYQRRDTVTMPTPPPFKQRYAYPELKSITRATGRVYHTPAGRLPSITTMLSATQAADKAKGLAEWRAAVGDEEADRVTEESSTFGTLVHDTMEAYLRHTPIDFSKIHALARKAIIELAHELDGKFEETWALEVPLYSENLRIAGRTDVIGMWKGELVILDYKTSRSPKGLERIEDYRLQLLFYALAHNERYGTNIRKGIIAMAVMTGKPQVFEIDLWDKELWAQFEERLVQFHGEFL